MNKKEIAELWFEIVNASLRDTFGSKFTYITDTQAQPGYIGSQYQENGVLLIGMNPASDATGVNNGLVYKELKQLSKDEATLDNLNQVIASVMPSWPLYRNCIYPILEHLNLSLHDIALINMLPYRADSPDKLYEASWKKFGSRQVDCIAPRQIVALGSGVGDAVQKYYKGTIPIQSVRRSRGDKYISAETVSDILNLTR